MSRSLWHRGAGGVCVLALLGVATASAPLAGIDPRRIPGDLGIGREGPGEPGDFFDLGPGPEGGTPWADGKDEQGGSDGPDVSYVPASYTDSGIPKVALRAYRDAAELIERTDPGCNLHWSLLAAIGRVESNHGQHGGTTIYRSGQTSPPILGLVLDGSGETAEITDTDNGNLDGNGTYDRAVGPMQFLPETWALTGVDGDGDGEADPNNIFDAAASAGRYLCAGDVDLSDRQQLRDAVFSYNHSSEYVNLVLRIAAEYRDGDFPTTPSVPDSREGPDPLDPPDDGLPPASPDDPGQRNRPESDGPSDWTGWTDKGRDDNSNRQDRSAPPDDNRDPGDDNDNTDNDGDTKPPGDTNDPPSDKNPPDTTPPQDNDPGDDSDGPKEPTAPAVTEVSPAKGVVGETITIRGARLDGATVKFGDRDANVLRSSNGTLKVAAPERAGAGAVHIAVRSAGKAAKSSPTFTYLPHVEELKPASGSVKGGDEVVLTGNSLKAATVRFGSKSVEPEPKKSTSTKLTVTTPARGQPGTVGVTVLSEGLTADAGDFTYQPVITRVTPESAAPGTKVTLHGGGFSGKSTVTLIATRREDEITGEKVQFSTKKPEQLTFTAPESTKPGEYRVVVTTNDVASDPVTLTITKPE